MNCNVMCANSKCIKNLWVRSLASGVHPAVTSASSERVIYWKLFAVSNSTSPISIFRPLKL